MHTRIWGERRLAKPPLETSNLMPPGVPGEPPRPDEAVTPEERALRRPPVIEDAGDEEIPSEVFASPPDGGGVGANEQEWWPGALACTSTALRMDPQTHSSKFILESTEFHTVKCYIPC